METVLMYIIGLLLGLTGIGLAELSYVFIKRYDIPGFYWPDIEEDEDSDV
ncbi:membrane protein [Streptomyces phage Bmoc]|uniref:Membrane protein n=1 Tax=Streptomyces phage Bmoc TaxID=2725629 RepID=A0A6M3SYA0_9CAUD|nr:membrane protein [Streptomyces phage Bmoc]QJD50956.1 membrane protein [Streptomyces phage Bmoc]